MPKGVDPLGDRRLKCHDIPRNSAMLKRPIVGLAELEELLALHRSYIRELSHGGNFPRPLTHLASGRIWTTEAIVQWGIAKGRIRIVDPVTK